MNTQGESNNNPILLEGDVANKSDDEPTVEVQAPTTEQFVPTQQMAMQAQRALDAQRKALQQYNDQMSLKRVATAVTPGKDERKKKKIKLEDENYDDTMHNKPKVIIVESTKTITDENGLVTTIKTKEEISKPATATTESLRQSQSTLSVYGFTGQTADSSKVIPIYKAKVVKKKDQEAKQRELATTIKDLDYITVQDDPLSQEVSKLVRESNVLFLNIKEMEGQESEPRYFMFETVEPIRGMGREDETIHPNCADCFCDACYKYLWGPYCIAAVERYFEENKYIANKRDAYVVYVAHLNRRLNAHSYDDSGNAEALRPTQISRPPICMREGSLSYCISWIKWQRTCGPHAEWYASQQRRRQRTRITSEAKEQMENRLGQLN